MGLNYAVSAYCNVFAYVAEAADSGSVAYFCVVAYNDIVPYCNVFAELDVFAYYYAFASFGCGHCLFSFAFFTIAV